MNAILNMVVLGLIAGMIAGLWTRVIRKNMIFVRFGRWLENEDNKHMIQTTKHDPVVKFLQCIFCISPWLCLVFDVFYIIDQTPYWIYAAIGVLGSMGAGNLVCEIIHTLRNE